MSAEHFHFLRGEIVNQLWFWGTIRLRFDRPSADSWYVDVHRCRLRTPDGALTLIDAAGPPADTAPMLQLLKEIVSDAFAAEGVLTLKFANGVTLDALPDELYESWTVRGPEGVTQCLPGGEVGSW